MNPPDWARSAAQAMALGVAVVSVVSFIGHLFRLRFLFEWGVLPGMAVLTAICMALLAGCVLLLLRHGD